MGSASSSYPTPTRPNFTRHDGASASASSSSASAAERPPVTAASSSGGKMQFTSTPKAIADFKKKTVTKTPSRPTRTIRTDTEVGWWRLHATAKEVRDQLILRKVSEDLWKGKTKKENIALLVKIIKSERQVGARYLSCVMINEP